MWFVNGRDFRVLLCQGLLRAKRAAWHAYRFAGRDREAWNGQHAAGLWDRGQRSPHVVQYLTSLGRGGLVVEWGCGNGTLLASPGRGAIARYVGYDISDVAVGRARQRWGTTDAIRFERRDMREGPGDAPPTLVIVEECIYYISPSEASVFLERSSRALSPGGRILVVLPASRRYERWSRVCRQVCRVVEERVVRDRRYLVLAAQ